MKRKADRTAATNGHGNGKKRAIGESKVHEYFRQGLFAPEALNAYSEEYAGSAPYKHAVIPELIEDGLLSSVRTEIVDNIQFTPKETDIYKIHQSGDLANLDGLPESALEKLPSLLKLRNALYSREFRQWISTVSGSGPLSGQKTDMAVNVYVPGCHLLCHDDVIGSRRVSYILYLTDKAYPWQEAWGGALRLYPVDEVKGKDKRMPKLPQSQWSKSIPPAWNQLSFFAVQPGESFHDVGEVLHQPPKSDVEDGGRVRMAISGWFHIPQEGEEGYEPGLEEKLAQKSSLQQLQGKADELDQPQPTWVDPGVLKGSQKQQESEVELTEDELQYLIGFINPNYLTPDTVDELNTMFTETSTVQLSDFLSNTCSLKLSANLSSPDEPPLSFEMSRPPHKHHYEYLLANQAATGNAHMIRRLLNDLFPSLAFRKWLALVTGLQLKRTSVLARRFCRGRDYQLAQSYEGENPQLEYTLCITPSHVRDGGKDQTTSEDAPNLSEGKNAKNDDDNTGGYELYMAGDEVDDEEAGSETGVPVPQSSTGAGDRRTSKKTKADPAIYQAAADDEDDGILFSNSADWNTLSIVLRDKGTLKFVKYVSQSAEADRYDFTGCVEVEPEDEDEDGDGDEGEGEDEDDDNDDDDDDEDGDEDDEVDEDES